MAFIKRLFKNKGEATETDPRIDAKFLNELQDEVIKLGDKPQLWTGSIGVGESITIKGINEYSVLMVYMSGYGILHIQRKNTYNSSAYTGIGAVISSADNSTVILGVCSFSSVGETLTLRRARQHTIESLANFNNGSQDTAKITAIHGIL